MSFGCFVSSKGWEMVKSKELEETSNEIGRLGEVESFGKFGKSGR